MKCLKSEISIYILIGLRPRQKAAIYIHHYAFVSIQCANTAKLIVYAVATFYIIMAYMALRLTQYCNKTRIFLFGVV